MTQRKPAQDSERKNLPSGLHHQGDESEEEDSGLDESTVEAYHDVGHFPDRDQMFGTDRHRYPAEGATPAGRWSGDMEETVKGNRDAGNDAVEELHDAETIVDEGSGNQGLADLPSGKQIEPQTAIPKHSDRNAGITSKEQQSGKRSKG